MDDWFKRAALSTFVGLTAAIVAGGTIVMTGAALGRWVITAYPPEVSLPLIVLGTLLVAGILLFAGYRAFAAGAHDRTAADPLHLLVSTLGKDRPGSLVLVAFLAGLALSQRGPRATPSRSP